MPRLLSGHLEADESLLTGESVPVRKVPGADGCRSFSPAPWLPAASVLAESPPRYRHGIGSHRTGPGFDRGSDSGLQLASRRLVRFSRWRP